MTSTAPWLSRQRKSDLVEMAESAGMTSFKNLKKSDLEEEVDNFLRANQTTLAANPKLGEFYKRVKDGSPAAAGKELVKSESKTPSKPRRRTIAPKDDIVSDSETPSDANNLRTPARQSLGVASQIPLPPSPAVIAQEVERQTARLSTWANQKYAKTGVQSYVEKVRDQASTSNSVNTLFQAIEAYNVLRNLLPLKSLGVTVPLSVIRLADYHITAPQFWNLLEAHFWSSVLLWSAVSVFLPAFAAYIFNLPLKAKRHGTKAVNSKFDPFIFNVAKAVLTWVVFAQRIDLPTLVLKAARITVDKAIPGGYIWLLVSSGIGALVALYEAILRH